MASGDDVTRVNFEDSDSERDLEGFEMVTERDCDSLSTVSSVHTSDLSDYTSDCETEIQGNAAAPAWLGCEIELAYERSWLKDFTERIGPLLHSNDSGVCEIFFHFFKRFDWYYGHRD